ncbi:MAG: NADP-dependent oxidoreductase [Sphingomonadales bacterium]|nr:NADP-dependent oxidoreductase [Sphingomonadales bacterium]
MGNEFAGIVEACGAGVSRFAPGQRVFARTGKERMGAFAEYACEAEQNLAAIPDGLSFEQAAAIPLAGLTALQALRDELHLGPGSRVFIPGGAGGVGTFAIRIAKWLGAHVATTASPRGRALVEQLGADEVIDYESEAFEDRLSGYDGAFDLIGSDTLSRCFDVVRPGGMVVSVAGLPEPQTASKDLDRGAVLRAMFWLASWRLRAQARRNGVTYRFLFMHPSGTELAELGTLAEAGLLTPVIDRVLPFAQIDQALADLEAGHAKGKIVVSLQAAG